ncbi:MAG: hypothetical protein F4Y53_04680, partial [Proteobacteria bacterium]|nr:hypothetical protein [Pseudomonadota bacterium]
GLIQIRPKWDQGNFSVGLGFNSKVVKEAMRRGIHAAADKGTLIVTAGNYGGELGKYKFYLHDIFN